MQVEYGQMKLWVVDENLVSSRWPKDLPEYMKAFIEVLKK